MTDFLGLGATAVFACAIALSNVWATIVLAASMARFDLFGGTDFVASLLALIPSFAGLAIGQWLRGYIIVRAAHDLVQRLIGNDRMTKDGQTTIPVRQPKHLAACRT